MSCFKISIFYLIAFLCIVNGANAENIVYTDLYNNTINLNDTCSTEKPCVTKCCGVGMMLSNTVHCVKIPDSLKKQDYNYTELKIYSRNLDVKNKKQLNVTAMDKFTIITTSAPIIYYEPKEFYVTDDGMLAEYHPNQLEEWFVADFCMDYILSKDEATKTFAVYFYEIEEPYVPESFARSLYGGICLIISCFFMLISLIVYALLPELRNLNGLISTATILTVFCAFLNYGIDNLYRSPSAQQCLVIAVTKYFLTLSLFFWMTVNSFDKFITFYRKLPVLYMSRVAKRKKFAVYCLFAWGIPLLMTIFVEVLETVDLSNTNIIKPRLSGEDIGCFFSINYTDYEIALYLYLPISILIFINISFAFTTGLIIWRTNKSFTQRLANGRRDSAKSKPDNQYYWVYLKLSTLTGGTWIFYIMSSYLPIKYEWVKYITDTLNVLLGVAIFFMFIFKKRIYDMLLKKYMPSKLGPTMESRFENESSSRSTTTMRKSSATNNPEKCVSYNANDNEILNNINEQNHDTIEI